MTCIILFVTGFIIKSFVISYILLIFPYNFRRYFFLLYIAYCITKLFKCYVAAIKKYKPNAK